jgi:hypothetical protein
MDRMINVKGHLIHATHHLKMCRSTKDGSPLGFHPIKRGKIGV